jgi:predicted NBD/HSP70 family sugar kinase
VVRLADALIQEASAPVLGVGIGTPGIVDLEGRVVEASNLGWHGLPLQQELATRFELPVRVANDAHVAALGEFGTHPGTNLALVKVGVGIGAGLMVDGHLYRGDRPAAGEVGHIRVSDRGLPCTCGNSGCLETVASVPSIIRQAVAASGPHVDPLSLPWDARHLAEVLGERPVRQAIDRAGRSLGAVLAHLVAILDLHHLAVSLELEHGEEAFLAAVAGEVRARVLPALASEVEIVASSHGDDLVTSGAALLVLSEQLGVVWQ